MRLKIAGSLLFALGALLLLVGCGQPAGTAVATPDTAAQLGPTSTTASKAPPTNTTAPYLPLALPTGGPELLTAQAAQITAMAAVGTVFPPRTPTPLPNGLSEENLQQTAVAGATQNPIPTGEPAVVQQGAPASVSAQRDGLELRFSLPSDNYMIGQADSVTVYLKNNSTETFYAQPPGLGLRNADGTPVNTGLFGPDTNWRYDGIAGMPKELAPGQTISATHTFQIPPTVQAQGLGYRLWAAASFTRERPVERGSDGISATIESGPLALHVVQAPADKQLVGKFKGDNRYWEIEVKTADGQVPTQPLSLGAELVFDQGSSTGPLPAPTSNLIKGAWKDDFSTYDDSGNIRYRFWVAAPGYTTAFITGTIAGVNPAPTPYPTPIGDINGSFSSLDEAETALNTQIPTIQKLPSGAKLTTLTGALSHYNGTQNIGVQQTYSLPNGFTLRLMVNKSIPADTSQSLSNDPNERPITIAGQPARMRETLGVRSIDWIVGGTGVYLEAAMEQFTLQELEDIAASVGPLP